MRGKAFGHRSHQCGGIHGTNSQVIGAGFNPAEFLQIVYETIEPLRFRMDLLIGLIGSGQDAVHQGFIETGAEGLLFIPYISGQQSPDWNAKQRGGFVGLGVEHGLAHFSRAVLEGLAFSLNRIANTVGSNLQLSPDRIYMSGGITNSEVWLQLAADVFGRDVFALENIEGSAKGSVLLGLLALGIIAKPDELSAPDTEYKIFKANENNHKAYQGIFGRFENALKNLHN